MSNIVSVEADNVLEKPIWTISIEQRDSVRWWLSSAKKNIPRQYWCFSLPLGYIFDDHEENLYELSRWNIDEFFFFGCIVSIDQSLSVPNIRLCSLSNFQEPNFIEDVEKGFLHHPSLSFRQRSNPSKAKIAFSAPRAQLTERTWVNQYFTVHSCQCI